MGIGAGGGGAVAPSPSRPIFEVTTEVKHNNFRTQYSVNY